MTTELAETYLKMMRDLASLGSPGHRALINYEEGCFALMRARIQRLTRALIGEPPPDLDVVNKDLQNAARAILALAPDLACEAVHRAAENPSDPAVLASFYELVRSDFNR